MHLTMLMSIVAVAWIWRCFKFDASHWSEQWQHRLIDLMLPPLLLLMTMIAILYMGPHGWMVWGWEGWVSYLLAIAFLAFAGLCWLKMIINGYILLAKIRCYQHCELNGSVVVVLDNITPFIAQIGFWQPELVISQGLIDTLDYDQLQVVMAHEQAHYHYRDTFWFFLLSWLRQISSCFPRSQEIWEDLLMLRELRADRWAAQQTDGLLLAEALLLVVQTAPLDTPNYAAFNDVASPERLICRINALVNVIEPINSPSPWKWAWLVLTLLPLLIIPLHG
jgi:Peptidase family M48